MRAPIRPIGSATGVTDRIQRFVMVHRIGRSPYLPRCWIADPKRCAAAGIPAGTVFATKPRLARRIWPRYSAGEGAKGHRY